MDVEAVEVGGEVLYLVSWPVEQPKVELPHAEEAVLRGIEAGLSNTQIAAQRGTSPRTVANQIARLLRRFGVSSRHELIAMARKG